MIYDSIFAKSWISPARVLPDVFNSTQVGFAKSETATLVLPSSSSGVHLSHSQHLIIIFSK
jgi:hypothetical protein